MIHDIRTETAKILKYVSFDSIILQRYRKLLQSELKFEKLFFFSAEVIKIKFACKLLYMRFIK